MKKLLLLSLSLLFLVNACQKDSQNEKLKNALTFESDITQPFTIVADSIVTIKGQKETDIIFRALDLKGVNIGDSLTVNLVELTSKEDLLMANAQTVSNGRWLISGGAFKIEIEKNGESLELRDGKTVTIKFPFSTKEKNMQLFYGDRDENDNMNWEETSIKVQDESYFSIFYTDSIILDKAMTKKYGVEMKREILLIDTLGYIPLNIIERNFERLILNNDTLRIYRDINPLLENNEDEVIEIETFPITKKQADSIIKNYYLNDIEIEENTSYNDSLQNISFSALEIEEMNKKYQEEIVAIREFNKTRNKLFETIEVSKLGWINIDRFARDEKKVKITFSSNVDLDSWETFIVDNKNRTILNVLENKVEIPVNRNFIIISFGIKEKTFYGFKKSVKFNSDDTYHLIYKKINESRIKTMMRID